MPAITALLNRRQRRVRIYVAAGCTIPIIQLFYCISGIWIFMLLMRAGLVVVRVATCTIRLITWELVYRHLGISNVASGAFKCSPVIGVIAGVVVERWIPIVSQMTVITFAVCDEMTARFPGRDSAVVARATASKNFAVVDESDGAPGKSRMT